jgi:hypothetical protein
VTAVDGNASSTDGQLACGLSAYQQNMGKVCEGVGVVGCSLPRSPLLVFWGRSRVKILKLQDSSASASRFIGRHTIPEYMVRTVQLI